LKTGGVSLERLDPAAPAENADTWERVLRKLRHDEMPPPGLPRPDAQSVETFAASVEAALDRGAAEHPNPGRPALHRLNRAEYSNAVRDLLGVDIQAGSLLPVDDSGYGFDNIADVLSLSPALLERYLSVARTVSRLAVGDLRTKPSEQMFLPSKDAKSQYRRGLRLEQISSDLPFDSRNGIVFQYYFPLDAEYVLRVNLPTEAASFGEGIHGDVMHQDLRVPVKAGLHTVGVTFLREGAKPEFEAPGVRRGNPVLGRPEELENDRLPVEMDVRMDGARLKLIEVVRRPGSNPDVASVVVSGPFNVSGRGDTPSRQRIFACHPAAATKEEACAHKILAALARRAFRRPVTENDLRPLLEFYRAGRQDADFDSGIAEAIEAVLISPDFLFRVEQDPPGAPAGTVYRVTDVDLASRLAFFLWSSIPDEELLALAEQGKLRDPAVRAQQVERMLRDARSQALVSNFAGQWLYLRNLATIKPDPQLFPEFDETLRRSVQQQAELFFESILRENRSVLELLNADYTFLNQRLAEHYGVPDFYGPQFRRVPLQDPNRAGLLGLPAILTVTSYPNRTSVVQRGKWILENLLGSPPPPPPPDVPELKAESSDGKPLSMRQQMERHRANPICSGCHARMDPIGFALENYDAIGRWRTKDAGASIDASGKLPDGTGFDGPVGLAKLLVSRYRDDFVSTVTRKLMTYALGRGLEYYDEPAVRLIVRRAAKENYTLTALIDGVVESTPFQMRRTPGP
jgi:hypothetical protein